MSETLYVIGAAVLLIFAISLILALLSRVDIKANRQAPTTKIVTPRRVTISWHRRMSANELRLFVSGPSGSEIFVLELSDQDVLDLTACILECEPYKDEPTPTSPSGPSRPRRRDFSLIDGGKN